MILKHNHKQILSNVMCYDLRPQIFLSFPFSNWGGNKSFGSKVMCHDNSCQKLKKKKVIKMQVNCICCIFLSIPRIIELYNIAVYGCWTPLSFLISYIQLLRCFLRFLAFSTGRKKTNYRQLILGCFTFLDQSPLSLDCFKQPFCADVDS